MKRLRVAVVAPVESVHTQRFVEGMAKVGCQMEVLAFSKVGTHELSRLKNVRVHLLVDDTYQNKIWQKIVVAAKAWIKLREIKPDIIHAHYISAFGWLACFFKSAPVVVSVWGSDLFVEPRRFPVNIMNPLTLLVADKVCVHSEYMRNFLADQWRINPAKIFVGGFGIDRQKSIARDWRKILKIPKTSKLVVHCRFMQEIYNPLILIRAWRMVCKKQKNVILVLPRYRSDGESERVIRKYLAKHNIEKRVRWLESVTVSEFTDLLKSSSLGVSIPSSDGMSISVWEAMSVGCQLVVSDLPQYQGFFEDRKNGLVVKVGCVSETARAIMKLLQDGTLKKKIASNNVKKMKEIGDRKTEMEKVKKLYLSLA